MNPEEFYPWAETPEFKEYLRRASELLKADDIDGLVRLMAEIRENRRGE